MLVLPGDALTSLGAASAGAGVFVGADGVLRASLAGRAVREGAAVRVERDAGGGGAALLAARVPEVGQRVLARVKRITSAAAHVEILLAEGRPLAAAFSGVIARENVRDGPVDATLVADAFVPGDLVVAVVASLGDASSFFLTTAPVSCGVVSARAADGEPLAALNAGEMATAEGVVERRKVARLAVAAGLADALAD